ncbi:MAG: hypothetical protein DRJ03_28510, partial [Chloroflexi bacterium]
MQLYLTPVAIGYLTQLILATLISGYFLLLLRQSRRVPHIAWLTGFFVALTAFIATLFLEAALLPTPRLYAVFLQNALLGAALTCLLQFAYHFPVQMAARRREAWAALILSGLYTLWEAGYALFRFAQLRAGHVLYRPAWSDYALLLFLLWAPLSFYRHTPAPFSDNRGWRRWIKFFLHPATRQARAARGFALIFLFVVSLNVFNILRSAYLLSVALANLSISLGMLVALSSFAVTYLNYYPETTSFMIKLVGVTLAVVLAIMGVVGWVASPFYEEHYHPALPDQRTLRFTPNEAGGYTITEIPFAFAREWGRKLALAEDAAHTCSGALGFEFPFYGQVYSQLYVCNDGTVSLGQGLAYRMYQYRYGAGAPLILPLLTDLYPEISPGGIFVQQEPERLVVTWERMRGFRQQEIEFTFQVILYPSGVFDFNYNGLPARLAYHPDDDPGASVWAIGALPGGLERRAGPQLVALTDLPISTGPDGVLEDYLLEFRQHLHQLFAPLAGLILIASLLIVGGFPLLFYVTLVNPLNTLLRGVRRIEAGDYTGSVSVQYTDEIGYLAGAFNTLSAQLGDLIHTLEARVAARTAALDATNVQLRAEIAEREQARAIIIEQQRALATLEERERLGRGLHDGLGQELGYLNVQAQAVATMLAAGQITPAQANLRRIVQTAQKTHADVRNYILGLRAEDAPRQDFWEALGDYLSQFQTTYGIETDLSRPDDAPSPAFGPSVEKQLLRIIQEALTNTRKHAAAQRVQVLFNFTAAAAHVIIADDGCGFEPSPPLSPPQAGGRFGLQMMRERAQAVGGQVEIRSAPEQGACVLVHIPLLSPALGGDAETSGLAGLRLLLVDDHPLFLEGLRSLLTARGFTVVGTACDGESALEQTRALRPDVVVMDVNMPGGGGLKATRAIKAELPETKIVMLTVAEDDATLFEAIESGAAGYLLKGLDANQFCALLAGLLRDDAPLAPGLAARIMAEFSHSRGDPRGRPDMAELTPHQKEILSLV